MTRYLLDTNAVIAVLRGAGSVRDRLVGHAPSDVMVSSIVMHEFFYGAFKSQRTESNVALVDSLLFEVLEFDREDARQAGEIRAQLARQGSEIGPYDVLLAGQAVARGLTLVTHNMREFERVPRLLTEDWESAEQPPAQA
ncbi:type II toxin-antitoxin system VapC family toxin [Rhodocyclaceae bacterium SMB388]